MAEKQKLDILASMTGSGPVGRAPSGSDQNWAQDDMAGDQVFDVPTGDPTEDAKRKPVEPPDPMRAVRKARGDGREDYVPMDAHKKRISRMARKNQALEAELEKIRAEKMELEAKQSRASRLNMIEERLSELGDEYSPEDREAALLDVVDDLVQRKVQSALSDVDRRFQKMEAFRGLSEEQMAALEETRDAYPGVNDPQKLLNLTKLENPDVFLEMQGHGGPAYVGSPGRGSEGEARADDPVSSGDIAKAMRENPELAMDLGPYLIKAEMDERYPGIHGSGNGPIRRGQI